jgi:membrane protease YdiL (CAAX protease family)
MNPTPPESDSRISAPDTAPDSSSPPTPFSISNLFLDPHGLRPIWSIALFLALWILLRQLTLPIAQALLPSTSPAGHLIPARAEYIFEASSLLCVAAATWFMAQLESSPISAYGFRLRHSLRNFAAGTAWGIALLSLLVFTLHASGLLMFDSRLLFRTSILQYAIVWAVGFLLVALAEESLLRGYLQFTLTRALTAIFRRLTPTHAELIAFWTAAILLSIAFGAIHSNNPGESPIGLLAATLVGLIFCLSLWRTGSLWWAIGFHAAWDWAQSFLYGVPDSGLLIQGHLFATNPTGRPILSGGLTGPEGSLLIVPILLATCAALILTQPRTHTPYIEASTAPPSAALDLP